MGVKTGFRPKSAFIRAGQHRGGAAAQSEGERKINAPNTSPTIKTAASGIQARLS